MSKRKPSGRLSRLSDPPYACESFVGLFGIWSNDGVIIRTAFLSEEQPYRRPSTQSEKRIAATINRYFENPRYDLSGLALPPARTEMQQALCRLMRSTKAGELLSYATVARILNTGARAIGTACAHNPYPVVVPCHRIIAANGLGGYTGPEDRQTNLWIKRHLIAHETVAGLRLPEDKFPDSL